MVKLALAALAIAACQGHSSGSGSGSSPPPPARLDAGVAMTTTPADAETTSDAGADEPEQPPDPGKLIADLGAIPAWQAVVDRGQYLARRDLHGVVYGTLGAAIQMPDPNSDGGLVASPYTWLVDDTEGNGALAIRVALGRLASKAKQGDRIALAGAWKLDDALQYYWAPVELTVLPPAPKSDIKDPPSQPGHTIVNGELPSGAHTITVAKDDETVYFMVTGKPPAVAGDGWPVANELGDPTYALLNLPGERPSFGGQDFRTRDEHWQLKRGQTYWVRIGKIRKHGPDKPATINARTAPVRVN